MAWKVACPAAALIDGRPLGVVIDDLPVCLVRLGDEVRAVDDECSHDSVSLSEGEVENGTIECWMHSSRFDLRTGAVINPPATHPIATYATRIVQDTIEVDLDQSGGSSASEP